MIKKVLLGLFMCSLLATAVLLTRQSTIAHGSMSNPLSRVYACYLQNPESPDDVACAGVIEQSGTQPLYDWNEINIGNAAGQHLTIIPDGELCSAGREKYAAFDEPRTDWHRTIMPVGEPYTFEFAAYVPHNQGYFELFLTKDGYDPTQPLTWDDLESFAFFDEPPVVGGNYVMTADLPESKSGHHVLYTVWQRYDSQEAFYSCSDLWFGTDPTPVPTQAPGCTAPAWSSGVTYSEGDVVNYNGAEWYARWGSSTAPDTEGGANPWRIRNYCTPGGDPATATPTSPAATPTSPPPTATATSVGPTATSAPATATPVEPTATAVPATATPSGSASCEVDYNIVNNWGAGFQVDVTITNNDSTAVNGYELIWYMLYDEQIAGGGGWNATIIQDGKKVTVTNPPDTWNGTIAPNGGTSSFGFQATANGPIGVPTEFTLNGVACNDDTPPATATTVPPTATTAPPTATSVPATATPVAPTATSVPATATSVPPTATTAPPTATAVPATATPVVPTATPSVGASCEITYDIVNPWGNGAQVNLTITNTGSSAVQGYDLTWSFDSGETFASGWNASFASSGSAVTASNPASQWNGTIQPSGSVSFGFIFNHSGSYSVPTDFELNGAACSVN